jgi:hypothetical protein
MRDIVMCEHCGIALADCVYHRDQDLGARVSPAWPRATYTYYRHEVTLSEAMPPCSPKRIAREVFLRAPQVNYFGISSDEMGRVSVYANATTEEQRRAVVFAVEAELPVSIHADYTWPPSCSPYSPPP